MGAQRGNGEKAGSGRRSACDFGISRSRFGWLSVRFDGGPSYPEMVETLEGMVALHGHLVRRGESISGPEWLQRIDHSGVSAEESQIKAIQTLMDTV